jgi:hypothetical protein
MGHHTIILWPDSRASFQEAVFAEADWAPPYRSPVESGVVSGRATRRKHLLVQTLDDGVQRLQRHRHISRQLWAEIGQYSRRPRLCYWSGGDMRLTASKVPRDTWVSDLGPFWLGPKKRVPLSWGACLHLS